MDEDSEEAEEFEKGAGREDDEFGTPGGPSV
jgi:hypothetical protein